MKRFTKQACRENVAATFFPLKIFIPLCFNILSNVPRENRLADSLYTYIYIYIYIYIQLLQESDSIYLPLQRKYTPKLRKSKIDVTYLPFTKSQAISCQPDFNSLQPQPRTICCTSFSAMIFVSY